VVKKLKLFIGVAIFILISVILVGCTEPSPTPTPTPTPSPTPTPTPTPTPSQSVTLNLSAEKLAFDTSTITVPAGAEVTVIFNNKDSIPHNLAVYETSAANKEIFIGEIFSGPKVISYQFTAPAEPGTYFFRCDVHPRGMTGSFIVSGTSS
jgi:plastocyanin